LDLAIAVEALSMILASRRSNVTMILFSYVQHDSLHISALLIFMLFPGSPKYMALTRALECSEQRYGACVVWITMGNEKLTSK